MENMELDMVRTNEQAEYFKDTKIIDKSNNPLLCYHGTKSEIYNEIDFDKLGSQAGSGFGPFLYCSDSEDIAKYYAGGDESHMIAVYLDVRKPLNLTDRDKISFEQYAAILQKADQNLGKQCGILSVSKKTSVLILKKKDARFPKWSRPTTSHQGCDGVTIFSEGESPKSRNEQPTMFCMKTETKQILTS